MKFSILKIIHAFLTSRLDYCNSLFLSLPDTQINKLQRVQNACARLICNSSRYSRCRPLLNELHWLPVWQRIAFKVLLLTYKAIHGLAPTYIQELITMKSLSQSQSTYRLRSSQDPTLLSHPSRKSRPTLGDRAFLNAAPNLWNNLPPCIRQSSSLNLFKSKLKTHLFILHPFNSFLLGLCIFFLHFFSAFFVYLVMRSRVYLYR